MKGLRIAALSAGLILCACSETSRAAPEPLELPHWRECADRFGFELASMDAPLARGEEFAILCALAIDEGRDSPRSHLKNLYRIYRIRGREPERLDALVRRFDRRDVWAMLLNTHDFSGELDLVGIDYWGCPNFDATARELLLHVEPSANMDCVPRRFLFWG